MKNIFRAVISLTALLLFSCTGPQATPPHPGAPPLSLTGFDGGAFSISQYKGKVVILNFWNTKCLLCIKESSTLVPLQSKYRDRGIAVVGIAYEDEAVNLSKVAGQIKINYPVALGDSSEIQAFYGVRELPALVMIGRDGRIYSKHNEYMPAALLESEVEQLLAGEADREINGFQAAKQNSTSETMSAKVAEIDPARTEIAALNPVERKTFEDDLQAINCTCGCNKNFLSCQRSGMKCQLRTAAIQKELNKIKGR
jgi:thiol-disulfide isomerase/thioredoxin